MSVVQPEIAGGRVTVNLDALISNWRHLAKLAPGAEASAVVKGNAYGCGIEPVTKALFYAGCRTFFVAVPAEGARVKSVAPTARCFVLNGLFMDAVPYFMEHNLLPVLGTMEDVELWSTHARQESRKLGCALHMDSGMNRLGLTRRECERVAHLQSQDACLDVQIFMTHYACADDIGHPKTDLQRERFQQACALFPEATPSAANSAATLQASGHQFGLIRPGIALYGGEALNDTDNPMHPVVTLEGRINQIRLSKRGEAVGYGATETLKRDTKIAYVAMGYADGFHRAASHMGVPNRFVSAPVQAAFKGQKINGIGRISMDLMAFDVTDIPDDEIGQGDWIELFGPTIAVDDAARAAGTIGYEMLTGLGQRYSRHYLGASK